MRKDIHETLRDFRHRPGLKNLMTYLMFVVLATIIWCGRALRTVHDTTLPIEINYIGVPDKVSWEHDLPHSLQAEVRDAGTRLRVYRYKPLSITIDLSGQFSKRTGSIHITGNTLRTLVSTELQGTSKLLAIRPERIEASYTTQAQKTVPIRLKHEISCAPEYTLLREPELSTRHITLYGSKSLLDTITYVETEVLRLKDIKESSTHQVSLRLPKRTHAATSEVKVGLTVGRVTEKVIPLTIRTEGVPEDKTVRLFPQKVDVTLCVPIDEWEQVSDSDVVVYCRYSEEENLDKLPVELRYSNPHITSARAYPSAVEFMIENKP